MLYHQLEVNLPQQHYPIYIGEKLFDNTPLLTKHITGKQVMIVTNETIANLYLSPLQQALSHYQCHTVILPDGEQYKNLTQWEKILDALAQHQYHRDATLITLGGGVMGDIGGFAAACYQRGIAFIQIPTTLLAQVDASIGGKTAVNHPATKNLIGAFHQPKAVIIDLDTLKTLPQREFNAGLAEIVKTALIKDSDFFVWLEQHFSKLLQLNYPFLAEAILKSVEIKKNIVVADEKEQNIRALLNLGHTFAHAIEHELGYGHWLHGEAVSMGLVLAAQLSHSRHLLSAKDSQRIVNLLHEIGLPIHLPRELNKKQLIQAMQMDKKVLQNNLRFILLKSIGSAFICQDVTQQELECLTYFE